MTVFFHGNFGLDRSRMSQLLKLGLADPNLSDKDLANSFGYGPPFASIYRSWLHKTGITDIRRPIALTELGKVALSFDGTLSRAPTLWFMHHQLSQQPERAEAWYYFIHKFRQVHMRFSIEDLKQGLIVQLSPHDMKHFGQESKMIPIIARKLIECYTAPKALGSLSLVEDAGSGLYSFPDIDIPSPAASSISLRESYK